VSKGVVDAGCMLAFRLALRIVRRLFSESTIIENVFGSMCRWIPVWSYLLGVLLNYSTSQRTHSRYVALFLPTFIRLDHQFQGRSAITGLGLNAPGTVVGVPAPTKAIVEAVAASRRLPMVRTLTCRRRPLSNDTPCTDLYMDFRFPP
jgi:hypothetical protein